MTRSTPPVLGDLDDGHRVAAIAVARHAARAVLTRDANPEYHMMRGVLCMQASVETPIGTLWIDGGPSLVVSTTLAGREGMEISRRLVCEAPRDGQMCTAFTLMAWDDHAPDDNGATLQHGVASRLRRIATALERHGRQVASRLAAAEVAMREATSIASSLAGAYPAGGKAAAATLRAPWVADARIVWPHPVDQTAHSWLLSRLLPAIRVSGSIDSIAGTALVQIHPHGASAPRATSPVEIMRGLEGLPDEALPDHMRA